MRTAPILHQLRAALAADAPDAVLLERFAGHRDEAAFTALVSRHGPMVWGACRRMLADADAEEVFQATFRALARQAESIREGTAVGSWLHGVARRLALQVRRQAARRSRHEKSAASSCPPAPAGDPAGRELGMILDE